MAKNKDSLVMVLLVLATVGIIVASGRVSNPIQAAPPSRLHSWRLQGEGIDLAFQNMRNLGSEHETVEMKVVDKTGHEIIRILPGRMRYGPIELTRGTSGNMELSQWRTLVELGSVDSARKTLTLSLCDPDGVVIAKWQLLNAWPSKLKINPYPAEGTIELTSPEGAVEALTLVCEGIVRLEP